MTLVSSDGHVIIDGALSRLEPRAAAPVTAVLRQRGELKTPAGGESRLRRSLAQLGNQVMAPGSIQTGPKVTPLLVVRLPDEEEASSKTLEADIAALLKEVVA